MTVYPERLIAHPQFLGLRCQLFHCPLTLFLCCLSIGVQIEESYAPVSPNHVKRYLARLQQTDEVRARNIQLIGGLLSRQFSMYRNDGYSISLRHLGQ